MNKYFKRTIRRVYEEDCCRLPGDVMIIRVTDHDPEVACTYKLVSLAFDTVRDVTISDEKLLRSLKKACGDDPLTNDLFAELYIWAVLKQLGCVKSRKISGGDYDYL